jgi:hypothetical protein
MKAAAILGVVIVAAPGAAADVESRVLTHYLPQDYLETVVRTESWTKVALDVKGGLRKGDVVRVWAGGSIDRGNGDRPGQNVAGPEGPTAGAASEAKDLFLSPEPALAFALLWKTESSKVQKCAAAGKPLEIKLAKDNEGLWIGFNDARGQYRDNHLGKGRRHEFDPAWVRIEVVRIIVD